MEQKIKSFLISNQFKFLIIIGIVFIAVGYYYWYGYRPSKIRHDCSWAKEHADPWAERTKSQYDACIEKCSMFKPKVESLNRVVLSPLPCSCEMPHPYRPAIDWWEPAPKAYYDFCIHEHGL